MADLLRMLSFASRSLEAQRFGLDVTGQNIANAGTPGYTKRVVDLGSVAPVDRLTAGGGVEVLGVRSMRDQLIARRLWDELPSEQRDRAMAGALGVVEVSLGTAGRSLDKSLNDFFDAWAGVADAPTSATARQEVVLQGQSLATSFRDMAGRLQAAIRDTDERVRGTVEQINRLSDRIASLNRALSGTSPASGEGLYLRDEIGRAVEGLAGLVDIKATLRPEGGFDVELAGSGRPLVIGATGYGLTIVNRAGSGLAEVTSAGVTVTETISGGALGGLLKVRDTHVPDYQAQLDALAYAVADQVNAVHRGGYDQAGNTDILFFGAPGGVAGAAAALAMNPDLTAPGGGAQVAASGSGAVGDNGNARLLMGLRDRRVLAGGTATFNEGWAKLVYGVGRDTGAAAASQAARGEVVSQIRNLQDAVSGISLDEEAADMLRFQRAYEANARFFRSVDDVLTVLMQTFNR
jgi:flagellar hook-associated protein 1 FlgK